MHVCMFGLRFYSHIDSISVISSRRNGGDINLYALKYGLRLKESHLLRSGPECLTSTCNTPSYPGFYLTNCMIVDSADSRGAVVSYWREYVHEVQVHRLGCLSLPRKSVVSLTDGPGMTLDVYRGRKTTTQQQQ